MSQTLKGIGIKGDETGAQFIF